MDALSYGGWLSAEGQRAFASGNMQPNNGMGGGMMPPGPGMRGDMQQMGGRDSGMYSRRQPMNSPGGMMPTNMYDNGRMMNGPPPQQPHLGGGARRSPYDQPPPYNRNTYDQPPMGGMYGGASQPVGGYDEPQGSYQAPPAAFNPNMMLQSAGGYGGPMPRPTDVSGQSTVG